MDKQRISGKGQCRKDSWQGSKGDLNRPFWTLHKSLKNLGFKLFHIFEHNTTYQRIQEEKQKYKQIFYLNDTFGVWIWTK